jgi:hypothetical protein
MSYSAHQDTILLSGGDQIYILPTGLQCHRLELDIPVLLPMTSMRLVFVVWASPMLIDAQIVSSLFLLMLRSYYPLYL